MHGNPALIAPAELPAVSDPGDDLYHALVVERYGPLAEVQKERPPSRREIQRRQRILCGDE